MIVWITTAVLLAASAAASAATQTVRSGSVSASFSFKGLAPNFSHQTLKITRAGIVVYRKAVSSAYCGTLCWPGAVGTGGSSIHILDLESNRKPDVVLDLFTGGAHCCFAEQIFVFDASRHIYVKTERNFGDPGASVKDLGHQGGLEFVTADDSFADQFSPFVGSGLPLQILIFRHGHFIKVTRKYPKLLTADAAGWLKLYRHNLGEGVGFIAAWAADEDLLGHSALVKSTLASELHKGHLRGSVISGSKFVTALQKFLRRHGYVR